MEVLLNYLHLLEWGAYASIGALLLGGLNTLLILRLLGDKAPRGIWNPRQPPQPPRPPVWNPQTQQWETPTP